MKTTIEITGFPELVLEKAVELGIARSKTDALRIGVMELNNRFKLVRAPEDELAARKGTGEEAAPVKRKAESLKDVVKKYALQKNP